MNEQAINYYEQICKDEFVLPDEDINEQVMDTK